MSNFSEYAEYVRPALGRLLSSLGLDIEYKRGQGDSLYYDRNGREEEVLDLLGGYGAGFLGHNHPALLNEIYAFYKSHSPTLTQLSNRKGAGRLGKKLSEILEQETGKKFVVTFSNSGAEAVESAMKHTEYERSERCKEIQGRLEIALEAVKNGRKLGNHSELHEALEHNQKIFSTAPGFVVLGKSFHGKTSGALALTSNDNFRDPFKAILLKKIELPWGPTDQWNEILDSKTQEIYVLREEGNSVKTVSTRYWPFSAILVEPIQGEGGIRVLSTEAAAQLQLASQRIGVPIICDEIQSGMGRSGSFLASTRVGLAADHYVFSKSLGGGLCKIGVFAVKREKYIEDYGLVHSSTFAEDELSSRVALRVLEIIEEERLADKAKITGEEFLSKLREVQRDYPDVIEEVRGLGLMIGVQFSYNSEAVSNVLRMIHESHYFGYFVSGYLLKEWKIRVGPSLSSSKTIRLEPSAYISQDAILKFCGALRSLCEALRNENVLPLVNHLVFEKPMRRVEGSFRRHPLHARRDPPKPGVTKAGFLGHLLSVLDLRIFEPSFANLDGPELSKLYDRIDDKLDPVQFDRVRIKAMNGAEAELNFFGLLEGPMAFGRALESRNFNELEKKIQQVADMAKETGCEVFGLGALSSVIMNNGHRLLSRGMAITTGNSLTVKAGITSLKMAAESQDIDLRSSRTAVIGATGNIGSVYGTLLSQEAGEILLVGRKNAQRRLEGVAVRAIQFMGHKYGIDGGKQSPIWEFFRNTNAFQNLKGEKIDWLGFAQKALREAEGKSPIAITSDMFELQNTSLVLSASNAVDPIIEPEHLSDRLSVIVDVAAPQDVSERVLEEKPNAKVIHGGLIRVPNNPNFSMSGVPVPKGHCYACFAETIILAMKGCKLNFSYGTISPQQVEIIGEWADELGFEIVEYYRPRPQVLFGRDYHPIERPVPSLVLS